MCVVQLAMGCDRVARRAAYGVRKASRSGAAPCTKRESGWMSLHTAQNYARGAHAGCRPLLTRMQAWIFQDNGLHAL